MPVIALIQFGILLLQSGDCYLFFSRARHAVSVVHRFLCARLGLEINPHYHSGVHGAHED